MSAQFVNSLTGARPLLVEREMTPSVTITKGDFLELPNGKASKIGAQDDEPLFVANETKTSTATGGEKIECVAVGKLDSIWETAITPALNLLTGLSGSSTTAAVILSATTSYSLSDFVGGQLYCKELKQQRTITASTAVTAPNNITLTVTQPFTESVEGKTLSATPLGLNRSAVKFIASTFNTPSQAIADLTGGHCDIQGVDMVRNVVQYRIV